MIGSTLIVKPIEVNHKNNKLVFSAQYTQKERRQRRLQDLEEETVVQGRVASVVDFGVFVNLDGVDGLVHISELDWHRVKHPSELVDIGDEMEVKIVEVDVERERVKLSRKELLPSPWEMIEENYQPGDLVDVKITNVVDFGAFGELPEGVHGLIHASEVGYLDSANSEDVVEVGGTVIVKVLKVDAGRERISLSMRKVPMDKQLDWILKSREGIG
jgi:ribosomal protein S1